MLHRITVMLIIGFWVTMTSLLVVRELYPDSTQLNSIPISHIGRVVFQHEQSSDLVIRDKQKEVGYLHFQPRIVATTKEKQLEFHGNLRVTLPGAGKRMVAWVGTMSLDAAYNIAQLRVTLSMHESDPKQPVNQLELSVNTATNMATFDLSTNGQRLERGQFSLDQNGLVSLLERSGLPVSIFQSLLSKESALPESEVSARQASLKMNGETVSTFVISAKVGGQTFMEAHLTQLGQMLKAQVPSMGYKLLPYNAKETE